MRIALVFAALLAGACQSKSANPAIGSGSAGSGSAKRTTLDAKLPPLSGKPPVKTTDPITIAQLEKLSAMTFEDFTLEVTKYPTTVAIRQRVKLLRPRMSVNIYVGPCSETFKCRALTLDAWRADEAKLRADMVDDDLADRPDTTFEIGASTIGGQPAIYIYQAGQFFGKDERGNSKGAYSQSYTLNYNDGVNLLRVTVSFADDPRTSLDDMKKALPRSFMEKVATAFLDAYGQAWAG